jgi:hypothetical protein
VTTAEPPQSTRDPKRIYVTPQNQFAVGNNQRIWINGVNTPWNNWNDFSGTNFNESWWDNHFRILAENGVNASRVWISCNNNQGDGNNSTGSSRQVPIVTIGTNGMVTAVSQQHWDHLDRLFALAERHEIYIMATFLSFDHFKHNDWSNRVPERWRLMLQSTATINSFINTYTIPFVNRYKNNPYLWSIDLINEPDWIHEEDMQGNGVSGSARFSWEHISRFIAMNAAAIRKNSDILVTVGLASNKYHSDLAGFDGNMVSDTRLRNLAGNDPYAILDFWSPHYYDWVGQWFGHPFTRSPFGTLDSGGWGLPAGKPAIIAETGAGGTLGRSTTRGSNGFPTNGTTYTLTQDYVNAYNNGWQGVMAWSSNGVDDYGTRDGPRGGGTVREVLAAVRHMRDNFRALVFPGLAR